MADQHTYKFLPEDKCLSESQLFDYIDGKLKASDMHLLEKHILSCGFCSDALEGLEKVKSREKVAAFIPLAKVKDEDEKKEEPKVIPLHPNRKYYALAAGVVLILGITLFMKLSQSGDFSKAKMADLTQSDSMVAVMPPQKEDASEKNATRMDSSSPGRKTNAQTESEDQNGLAANKASAKDAQAYFKTAPAKDGELAPAPSIPDATVMERNLDEADDFVNVVDAKAAAEEQGVDNLKDADRAKQEQTVVTENKNKFIHLNRSEKANEDKKADAKPTVNEDVPMTTVISSGGVTGISQGTTPTTMTPPANYTLSGPASTGSTATTMDSTVTLVTKPTDHDLDLSYENANKMLAAGQATASLALYDEVLKNAAHPHFQDAQWKKSEALIQLKRIDEAKKLLNEIAAKPGKYQVQAKEKLKTL